MVACLTNPIEVDLRAGKPARVFMTLTICSFTFAVRTIQFVPTILDQNQRIDSIRGGVRFVRRGLCPASFSVPYSPAHSRD